MLMKVMDSKEHVMKEVIAWNPPINWIKERLESVGNKIGSVHFIKRSDGKLRKMSYRLHVKNPSTASKPKGLNVADGLTSSSYLKRKDINKSNNQITVFDTNKVIRDKSGEIIGRGDWRTVPLESVVRMSIDGVIYTINRDN